MTSVHPTNQHRAAKSNLRTVVRLLSSVCVSFFFIILLFLLLLTGTVGPHQRRCIASCLVSN
ncbi:hypothetical protein BDW42DRAFT_178944 [Aspergillus taichungensis]|uniref:Uncharacterized protein n=1 Tax=Aspergillus taichungensis TaxID=482145 RepID=A0A2J5HH48_9EURO|nr:hypothetical protein BDW42DRAFT_178944 [Aspergillus taichungensis]